MPRGGPRPGSGRKKGSPNKKSAELIAKVEASGLTPLEYMLSVLRDANASVHERMDAAKNAAPYVHRRLASVEHSGEVTTNYVAVLPADVESVEQWEQRYAPKH